MYGRKLSRTKNERRRLFAGLVRDLLIHGRITTTIAKAKAVAPMVEKLVTKAKGGSDPDFRRVLGILTNRALTKQLFEDAKTRFAGRTSGFTRIIKSGTRMGDATDTAMLSFVDERVIAEVAKVSDKLPKKLKSPKLLKKEKKS